MPSTFDELRQQYPDVGFAVYAYEPDGPVTLETITPDSVTFTWTRPTLDEAIAAAFPPEPEIDIFE